MAHFQDGGRDVISCRKVLPPGEYTWSVRLATAPASSWSTVYSHLLFNSH